MRGASLRIPEFRIVCGIGPGSLHKADRRSTSSQLADRVALRRLLAEHFGFDLPEVERLRVPSVPEWS